MYRARTRGGGRSSHQIISLTIPVTTATAGGGDGDSDGDELTCYICKSEFCTLSECLRSQTNMDCCTQPICTACMVKMAKRCTCAEDCDSVIAFCPFCREICPVAVSDLFLGACTVLCKRCKAFDAKAKAAADADAAAADQDQQATEAV